MRMGLIQVYTGDGKGKTTAALGLALRALGHDWHVTIIQFIKGDAKYGEIRALGQFSACRFLQYGREGWIDKNSPDPQDIALAKQGLEKVRRIFREGKCDLLILDEINVALAYNLLLEEEVREILCMRPAAMEVVLTGRYAPSWLLELADLVTEMRPVKHPLEKGIAAREGIEF